MPKKYSEYSEITALSGTDLLLVSHDNGDATFTTNKVKIENLPGATSDTVAFTGDFTIDETLNGKTASNFGSTQDVKGTFADGLSDGFGVRVVNEVGVVGVLSGTSYANAGGIGDRRATITVATDLNSTNINAVVTAVDGSVGSNNAYFSSADCTGKFFKFTFSEAKCITEADFIDDTPSSTFGSSVWQWQGSNNGTVWINIGGTFTGESSAGDDVMGSGHNHFRSTSMSANTQLYTQYRMLGISGSFGTNQYFREMCFKIANISDATTSYITLVPPTGSQLPNTATINRNLVSSAKGDSIEISKTANNFVGKSVFPAAANWVDTAP